MSYSKVNVKLSDNQVSKIKKAIKNDEEIKLRINDKGDHNTYLMLTNTDKKNIDKQIKLSKTQLKSNKQILEISNTTSKSTLNTTSKSKK